MKPHKHAELIKAWADGAEIQVLVRDGEWVKTPYPEWNEDTEYRIKPEPKPDRIMRALAIRGQVVFEGCYLHQWMIGRQPNLKLTFDGETGELKSAEVLK